MDRTSYYGYTLGEKLGGWHGGVWLEPPSRARQDGRRQVRSPTAHRVEPRLPRPLPAGRRACSARSAAIPTWSRSRTSNLEQGRFPSSWSTSRASLRELLRRGGSRARATLRLARERLPGASRTRHARGLVRRVKPKHPAPARWRGSKIADFGIARAVGTERMARLYSLSRATFTPRPPEDRRRAATGGLPEAGAQRAPSRQDLRPWRRNEAGREAGPPAIAIYCLGSRGLRDADGASGRGRARSGSRRSTVPRASSSTTSSSGAGSGIRRAVRRAGALWPSWPGQERHARRSPPAQAPEERPRACPPTLHSPAAGATGAAGAPTGRDAVGVAQRGGRAGRRRWWSC